MVILLILILLWGVRTESTPRFSTTLLHDRPLRSRPVLSGPESILSSDSGFFLIHYTESGSDATTMAYADSAAQLADSARAVLVFSSSWPDPPSDLGGGGDIRYDIYLLGLGAAVSGYVQVDFRTSGAFADSAAATYAVIATRMSEPELFASLAHHVAQACLYAYSAGELGAWLEQCGGWAEDFVFPDADQWNDVTGNYLINSHKHLYGSDGYTEYGALLWPKFLVESLSDTDIVRRIWLRCAQQEGTNTLTAVDDELQSLDAGTLASAFQEFTSWNYVSGNRDDGQHYQDGADITGSIEFIATHAAYPDSGTSLLVTAPYGLGANYIEFLQSGGSSLEISVKGDSLLGPWGAGILAEKRDGTYSYTTFAMDVTTGQGDTLITDWGNDRLVILIVQNLRYWASPQASFSYTAILPEAPTVPGILGTAVSGENIRLSWTESTDDENDLTGYRVYRGEKAYAGILEMLRIGDGINDQDIFTPGIQWSDENSFGADVVGDLSVNYFYRVTAVDALYNESGPSNTAGEVDNYVDDGP